MLEGTSLAEWFVFVDPKIMVDDVHDIMSRFSLRVCKCYGKLCCTSMMCICEG